MKKELIFLVLAIAMLFVGVQHLDEHVNPWLEPVVLEGELEAAEWVKANTPTDSFFMAGIFGGELIMGISGRTSIVGGDWAANANSPEQMSDMEELYKTHSAERAEEIWLKYNASYAWFPSRDVYAGYGWLMADENKMDGSLFEQVYSNDEVRIYKLRKSI